MDFAGPFLGHNYLVLVDTHSKWMDVPLMTSTTSAKTIEKLCMIFSTHGLPLNIVTDNGTVFTSNEFRQFMEQNVTGSRKRDHFADFYKIDFLLP